MKKMQEIVKLHCVCMLSKSRSTLEQQSFGFVAAICCTFSQMCLKSQISVTSLTVYPISETRRQQKCEREKVGKNAMCVRAGGREGGRYG